MIFIYHLILVLYCIVERRFSNHPLFFLILWRTPAVPISVRGGTGSCAGGSGGSGGSGGGTGGRIRESMDVGRGWLMGGILAHTTSTE